MLLTEYFFLCVRLGLLSCHLLDLNVGPFVNDVTICFTPHLDLRRLDEVHSGRSHSLHPHHSPQRNHDLKVSQSREWKYGGNQQGRINNKAD
jgi:hypothetical protein